MGSTVCCSPWNNDGNTRRPEVRRRWGGVSEIVKQKLVGIPTIFVYVLDACHNVRSQNLQENRSYLLLSLAFFFFFLLP